LLGKFNLHPQRKKGLVPLLKLNIGTYPNKRTGRDMPKPVYQIVGWVPKDGDAPVGNGGGGGELNDVIPF
jgi:hypothetical protein